MVLNGNHIVEHFKLWCILHYMRLIKCNAYLFQFLAVETAAAGCRQQQLCSYAKGPTRFIYIGELCKKFCGHENFSYQPKTFLIYTSIHSYWNSCSVAEFAICIMHSMSFGLNNHILTSSHIYIYSYLMHCHTGLGNYFETIYFFLNLNPFNF